MLDHGAAVRHGGRAKTLATHLRGRDGQTTLDGDAAATPASCEHSTVRRLAPSCLLRGSPVALGGSTLPGAEAGPRDAATASGAAQDAVDYLQESSRNHVRGHNRAQSARSKAPVVMAEPHHVFRSFPTTQVVWYTACKHAILMCVHTEVCVCHACVVHSHAERHAAPCPTLYPTSTQVANAKHARPATPSHRAVAAPTYLDFIAKQAAHAHAVHCAVHMQCMHTALRPSA